jgi:DHA1 family inner membrane transport protein
VTSLTHSASGAHATRGPAAGTVGFVCLFAAQAGLLTLSPILPSVARDFGVSTAAAGQLRTLVGLVGGAAALAVVLVGRRLALGRLLLAGNGLLVLGSLASALAPSLLALAAAQLAVGAATGLLVAGGLAAAAAWAAPERSTATVALASLGQPASWVAGMPLIGLSAELGWRYAWLGVPLAAGLAGLAATGMRPREEPAGAPAPRAYPLRWDVKLAGWAAGELLSYAAWAGTLVYAGALLIESYDADPGTVGLLLGASALAALPGNYLARPWLRGSSRELLVLLGLSAAAITAAFGTVRPGLAASAGTFALLVLVACTRTVAGSTFALYVTPARRLAAMGVRASTGQLGYLIGAGLGGAALAAGGYPLLCLTLAGLFASGAAPHLAVLVAERATPDTSAARLRRGRQA